MSHANARLTVHGRTELVRRVIEQGRPVAHVVVKLNVSRATGYKWLARWRAEGPAGLLNRSSRAHRLPGKTPAGLEGQVRALPSERRLGPARIGPLIGLAPSTVHTVRCLPGSVSEAGTSHRWALAGGSRHESTSAPSRHSRVQAMCACRPSSCCSWQAPRPMQIRRRPASFGHRGCVDPPGRRETMPGGATRAFSRSRSTSARLSSSADWATSRDRPLRQGPLHPRLRQGLRLPRAAPVPVCPA